MSQRLKSQKQQNDQEFWGFPGWLPPFFVPPRPSEIFLRMRDLLGGGQTAPIYGPDTALKTWHPHAGLSKIPGIIIGIGDVPSSYESSLDPITEIELRLTNESDQWRNLTVTLYEQRCRVTGYKTRKCEWDRVRTPVTPPRIVTLRPGGYREIDWLISTPEAPAKPQPNVGDTVRLRLIFHVTDEAGNSTTVTRAWRPRG